MYRLFSQKTDLMMTYMEKSYLLYMTNTPRKYIETTKLFE